MEGGAEEADKADTERLNPKIKVLGISCSPRLVENGHKHSRSEKLLEKFMGYVRQFGGEGEIINLLKTGMKSCEGCASDSKDSRQCVFPCIHRDDRTNEILLEIIASDALVLATPIYWGSASSSLRILIEKMTSLENNRDEILKKFGRDPLEGKTFVVLASQDVEGASLALSQITWALTQMGLMLLPYGLIFKQAILEKRLVRIGLRILGIKKFEWIENTIRLAARNTVLLTSLIKQNNFRFDDHKVIESQC